MKIPSLHIIAATLLLAGSILHAADRPNIILIMADDMGYSDIGSYGGEIDTPNLDRLAENGVRFTQFYNASRCCPTRACLLTGLYPHQAGVGDMVTNRGTPAYQGYLNEHCATIAELLGKNGYTTLMSGKWHIGEKRPHWPVDRGFDRYFGLISGACNYYRREPQRTWALDGKEWDTEDPDFYLTDAITDHAVEFLGDAEKKKDAPFFLYLAYNAPHWPLHAREEDIAKYRGKYNMGWDKLREERYARELKLGVIHPSVALSPRDPKVTPWERTKDQEEMALRMAVYAAQIDRMDQGIGKVLAKVKAMGAEQNTLIFFLADNGGCHEVVERSTDKTAPTGTADSFRSYGPAWANASNTPFRRYKHWVHEGGIATPLIVYWPAGMGAGADKSRFVHQPAHLIDIMPTCLAAAGVKYPADFNGHALTPIEGQSLLPLLIPPSPAPVEAEPRVIYWEHEGNRAVRQGQWKIVAVEGGPWELYDIAADRSELHDLAKEQPERVAAMSALYDAWEKRVQVVPRKKLKGREI